VDETFHTDFLSPDGHNDVMFTTPTDAEAITVTEADDAIVLVTLNRPDRLNAITSTMISELAAVVQAVDLDPAVRAVIVTGAGRGFSAGLDLQSQGRAPGAEGVNPTVGSFMWQDHLATLHEQIHRSRKPWIAAVNGPAVGGGFAMALACDIRYAAASATFGAVFLRIGVSNCDMGTSYFLPRLVGASRSAELMLTARIFPAAEALDMGLVLDVVDDGAESGADSTAPVVERALETARLIRANAPFGTWMTKETMWQTIDAPSLRHALDIENRTQIMCSATGDVAEARAAFVEKRPPVWRHL
jgi:enoyl-CoA hydratase